SGDRAERARCPLRSKAGVTGDKRKAYRSPGGAGRENAILRHAARETQRTAAIGDVGVGALVEEPARGAVTVGVLQSPGIGERYDLRLNGSRRAHNAILPADRPARSGDADRWRLSGAVGL